MQAEPVVEQMSVAAFCAWADAYVAETQAWLAEQLAKLAARRAETEDESDE